MYKVFDSINQIIFASIKLDDNAVLVKSRLEIQKFNKQGIFLFIFISKEPYQSLIDWYSDHNLIEAAGGLVERDATYLWIFRNQKWDLPKGKVEKNESIKDAALREVKEECGLDNSLVIIKPITTTFHVYILEGIKFLKRTHWYLMNYSGDDILKPQIEEGITDAVWANHIDSDCYSKSSFGNISLVWKSK
jgi:hypothetical protein